MKTIDLKSEVEHTLNTPRCKYSVLSKFFFLSMDIVAGRKTTVPKVIFLEMLASIPYRKWETRYYLRLSFAYRHKSVVDLASHMVEWSREAQDNEYWHLLVLNEYRKELGIAYPWYLNPFITHLALYGYMVFSWLLSRLSMRQALLFNAQFEDHAEHTYAEFVREHEDVLFKQPVTNELVRSYADVATWGDVLARIALDEREHRNNSFIEAGKPELAVNQ
ncbi:MAG TPA: alternative oxidase [Paludibacteraceae bacterium]|nr:alternative oxidase [Paludibacteraceae bacterium]HRS67318.1 alternative oxidase [Paludibacteraceae bacterium]